MTGVRQVGRVSNEPFREAFLLAGDTITAHEVAAHMGWTRKHTSRGKTRRRPDGTTAMRRLGLRGSRDGKTGNLSFVTTLTEDEALRLLPLFPSLDPVDVGV